MKNILMKYKFKIFISIVLIAFMCATEIGQAALFKIVFDKISGDNTYTIIQVIIASISFIILLFVSDVSFKVFKNRFLFSCIEEYRKKYIHSYIDSGVNITNSKLVNDSVNVMEKVERRYIEMIFRLLKDSILLFGALLTIFIINWQIFLLTITIIWIPVLVPFLLNKKIQKRNNILINNTEELIAKINDIHGGYEIINGFNAKNQIKKLFDLKNTELEKSKYNYNNLASVQESISITLSIGSFILIVLFSGYLGIKGIISIGSVMAVLQVLNYVLNPIMNIPIYRSNMFSVKKLISDLDSSINKKYPDGTCSIKNFKNIHLSNLSFSYDNEKNIFNSIDLSFQKNRKYLIIGESGCGKSTLIKLILQHPIGKYSGTISLNSVLIENIKRNDYFSMLSYISQNVFLFSDSIYNNILMYEEKNMNNMEEILKKCKLDKLINNLPNGIRTIIGEGGQTLSGGEMQRISIARAMIKNSDLILADEITSALDEQTGKEIEKIILESDFTFINVSHNIYRDNIELYDEIYEIKDGEIFRKEFEDILC